MLVSLRATRSAGVAALMATLALATPASASGLRRGSIRSVRNAPLTGAISARSHRRRHRAQATRVCPNANTSAVSASTQAMGAAVLCLVNKERATHGLPRLRASTELTRSAQAWSDEMVASGAFGHAPDFEARISNEGYDWAAVGENIATGFPTPRAVVTAWMADVGHCQNILTPLYRDLGVGINRQPVVGAATGPATWTQDFGLRAFQSPAASDWRPATGCPYG
jgi:uncharacterized protein YkwD